MLVKVCRGFELEKEKPNTSEDFFNRSEVVYVDNGEEKRFHVLYIRYFDELISDFPSFQLGERYVSFKDIVALVCLIKNPEFLHRKRVYINMKEEFASYFKGINYEKLTEIIKATETKQGYELQTASEILVQS